MENNKTVEENKIKKVRLKGNHSFNVREGWLRKGMKGIEENSDLFSRSDAAQILGVGSKMVPAIRYWLITTGLAKEEVIKNKHTLVITSDFGRIINNSDPYFEDIFTLYLMHYNIVTNKDMAIVWQLFYNTFEATSFTREEMQDVLIHELDKLMAPECTFSESLVRDDCNSLIKMYLNDEGENNPDDNLGSPFAILGLIKRSQSNKHCYEKAAPKFGEIDPLLILYIIIKNAQAGHVSINALLNNENNIGKVLNLSRPMINEYLDQLRLKGYININRTAGLDMVYITTDMSAEAVMEKYYSQES